MTVTPGPGGWPGDDGDLEAPPSPITWLLCDLVTGRYRTTLPIVADEKITKRAAQVDQVTVRLPLGDCNCPADWYEQLALGRTMLVAVLDDEPTQAWFVESFEVGDVTVPLTCKTLETCAERTFVPSYDQGDADDCTAAAALCQPLVDGFGFDVDLTPSDAAGGGGAYWEGETEDLFILDALNELLSANRIEWRIRLGWLNAEHRVVTKTIEIARTIGEVRTHVVFSRDAAGDGTVEDYRRIHSYAPGKGATVLQGVGTGSGSARPMTDALVSPLVAQGWPRWAERKTLTNLADPEAGYDDDQLLAATASLLPAREHGTVVAVITARDTAARPGVDYREGDTVFTKVDPTAPLWVDEEGRDGPQVDPIGATGPVRIIGWELDTASGQANPTVWEDEASAAG